MTHKEYIGDGVYCGLEESLGALVLETSDGIRATNTIVLEGEVWEALVLYVAKLKGRQP